MALLQLDKPWPPQSDNVSKRRTNCKWDRLVIAELGQAAPEVDQVGTPGISSWHAGICWAAELSSELATVLRSLFCLETLEFKPPQWWNMHRKGLMCINMDIQKCNRCMLVCEMHKLQRNYSSSYSPITGKCMKKNHFVWIFLSQHISEQLS